METIIETTAKKYSPRTIAGAIILLFGTLLLLNQFTFFFIPGWLFSWPMWVIVYGVFKGSKYNFKKPTWTIITLIGFAFLFTENIVNADRFIWPAVIMGIGVWMVFKHQNKTSIGY